ncbi:uncharacterized protein LOC122379326 [Amphibalanus amphitrite]|uniref:uncharacterized protein LOC122379326 n=1 Tax=Amphibalanus amphitrite TaxID=1232801 RepID=UPI001C92B27B|nr:uncharacterized protein LOC122379326 [Amphibalanus amphitrite]
MEDVEAPAAPERRFDRAYLRTWSAFFKLTESGLCALCFLCNELSWHPFLPYPARTFLSVCACLALISSVLLLLTLWLSCRPELQQYHLVEGLGGGSPGCMQFLPDGCFLGTTQHWWTDSRLPRIIGVWVFGVQYFPSGRHLPVCSAA